MRTRPQGRLLRSSPKTSSAGGMWPLGSRAAPRGRTQWEAVRPCPKNGTQHGRGTRRARFRHTPRGPASGVSPEVGTRGPQPHHSRSPEWKPPESGDRGSLGPDRVPPRSGHDSALGGKEIPTPAITWMRLEDSAVCEASQSQDTSCATPVLRGPWKSHVHRDRK